MSYSRRKFLSSCCYGALTLGVAPHLASCTARPAIPSRHLPASRRLEPTSAHILWHASLAPSGHNSQPWKVTLTTPSRWRIGIPPERRLPAVDPQGRETLLSLGAFVENLAQAAATQGLDVETHLLHQDPLCKDVLDLNLVPAPVASLDALQRMQQRRVVKKGHRNQALSSTDGRWLENFRPGQIHYLARESSDAAWLREGTVESMATQCQRDEAMRELAQWVRFGATARDTHRDGLTTASMEITGLAGWFVDHLMWPKDVLKPTFRKQTIEVTAQLAGEGAGWLLLVSRGSTPADLVETGRIFQRLFLRLRERNIACHPMSQMLEEDRGQRELRGRFGASLTPQMLLRIGYLDSYPDPVSLRRPPQWFVTA